LSLFRLPGFAGVQVFTFLLWAALSGALFFVPFRLQQIQGFKPLEAGMALLPFVIIVSILSRWAGGLSDRFGPRFPLMIGACFAGAGFLLLTLAGPQTSYIIGFMPALMTIGVGMGICVAPVTVAALSAAGEDNVGLASAINNMAARAGGLIAIAVFGLLLADRFDSALTSALAPLNLPDAALQALAAQRAKLAGADVPADLAPDLQLAVTAAIKLAFVNGYRWIMASAAAMAFVSSVIAATSMARGKAAARKTMVPQENVG
ncbi:MAG TPA: MFS transporter, partial [Terriglobales bacterium]|nr:MFS transporter [Terriglobales bacterium]